MKNIHLIVATDQHNGIARDNIIPWYIKDDLRYFQKITSKASDGFRNAVIMGRVTYNTLNRKPLKNRWNIVLTSQPNDFPEIDAFSNLQEAIDFCEHQDTIESIFIIGGERVYREALENYSMNTIYRTLIKDVYHCDRFLPELTGYQCLSKMDASSDGYNYSFEIWKRN